MMTLKEHPYEFQIEKAFSRAQKSPRKVVFFDLLHNQGHLVSFGQLQNTVCRAFLVIQHNSKPPSIIKLETSSQEKDTELKLILCPEKREVAIYIKSATQEYADYFRPDFCKKSRLWALFDLPNGIYGIMFDSDKYNIDYGFSWISDYSPNPFDLMSMGLKPNTKIIYRKEV